MNKLDLASIVLKNFNSVFASVDGPLVDVKPEVKVVKPIRVVIFCLCCLFYFSFGVRMYSTEPTEVAN